MARILVVDDEKSIRISIREFLKDDGHEVQIAEDAITALELLAEEEDFDVVVTDIILPKMSGVKLLQAIREVSKHVQVIMITGEPTIETASDALRLGAFDYLAKPVTKEAIVKVVTNAATTKALIDDKLRLEAENLNYQNNLERLVVERTRALRHFEHIVTSSTDMLALLDKDFVYLAANKTYHETFGLTHDEIIGHTLSELFGDEFFNSTIKPNALRCLTGEEVNFQEWFDFPSKGKLFMDVKFYPYIDENKEITGFVVNGRDVTEGKLMNDALHQSEARFRSVVETAGDSIISIDSQGKIVFMNKATGKMFGYSSDELSDKLITDLMPERFREAHRKGIERVVSGGETRVIGQTVELIGLKKDNSEFPIDLSLSEWEIDEGVFFTGIIRDITERKQAEEALRQSEEIFRNVIEQSNDAIYVLYEDRFDLINKPFTEIFGVTPKEAKLPEFNFMDMVAPESKSKIIERVDMRKRGEAVPSRYEFVAFNKDHNLIYVEASVAEISYRGGTAILGIIRDVTERKRLEEQFHQAQKMESVGRLAGGVAHDFNNLLTVITGHADMAMMSLDSRDPTGLDIDEIQNAAKRASDLTRQLLAFSRKQKLQPKVLNLNEITAQLNKMLQRMIGEDIDILMIPDQELWHVKIDPGQIEQVIINLAVNARDAMPSGGRLTIGTQNTVLDEDYTAVHGEITAGNYVLLTISDTGEGMSNTVIKQIFEPFFTTKAEGKGTGLGLSTVFGIVMQSGGDIEVLSELGEGTTFRIFLPQADEDIEEFVHEDDAIDLPRGSETILVAEDEDALRSLICVILKKQGYKLIEAQNGSEALMICRELDKPVDLVITDVVMPNMGGNILVKNLREIWTGVKVLYMSGYTAEKVADSEVLESDEPFLQKPFRPLDLAWKVRRVLDS